MQLKIRRSQRDGGVLSKTAIFCLDAMVDFSAEELESIRRYKLHNQVIYNSEASRRLLEKSEARQDGSFGGNLKSLGFAAVAAMRLNITISSLQRGQHIECKSLDELLGAEDAIMTACQNLKGYLDTAATFDGREVLVDFSAEAPTVIAQAISPQPILLTPSPQPAPISAPAEQYAAEPAEARVAGTSADIIGPAPTADYVSAAEVDPSVDPVFKMVGGLFLVFVIIWFVLHSANGM